jgi:hypothetical protein
MDDARSRGAPSAPRLSEGQFTIGWIVGVGDGLAVAVEEVAEIVSSTYQPLGELADRVAAMLDQAVLVAEQVGMLGDESHACDVQDVAEYGEGRQLGGAEQIHRSHGCQDGARVAPGGAGHARHRFFPAAARLAGAGT